MPKFTRENAAIIGKRGAIARWSRPPALPLPTAPPPLQPPSPAIVAQDDFQQRRLNRVRAQLDLVDVAIEREAKEDHPDGQRLNWLAQAQDRLSEQERILAGRPLPGSRRPSPEGGGRRNATPTTQGPWIPDEPPTIPPPTCCPSPPPAPSLPIGWEYDEPAPPTDDQAQAPPP